jgi:hypothetical protein
MELGVAVVEVRKVNRYPNENEHGQARVHDVKKTRWRVVAAAVCVPDSCTASC